MFLTDDEREALALAWSAIDEALKIPGFAEKLPMEKWKAISVLLGRLVTLPPSTD